MRRSGDRLIYVSKPDRLVLFEYEASAYYAPFVYTCKDVSKRHMTPISYIPKSLKMIQ